MGIEDDIAREPDEDDCDLGCDAGNEDDTVGDIVIAPAKNVHCRYFNEPYVLPVLWK